jgi:plasmid stability protein
MEGEKRRRQHKSAAHVLSETVRSLPALLDSRHPLDRLHIAFVLHPQESEVPMATLTIKNMPDDLYDQLKRRAAEDHRSLNGEAIFLLTQAVRERPGSVEALLARADELRRRAPNVWVTDQDIEDAINEGRR